MKKDFDNDFKYHFSDENKIEKCKEICNKAKEFILLVNKLCPESRELSLTFTKIEEATFWANAAITNNENKIKDEDKNDKNKEFIKAFDIITEKLKTDSDYYYSWQSNIAMQFQDVMHKADYDFSNLHKLSNEAAKNFLDLLISKSENKGN